MSRKVLPFLATCAVLLPGAALAAGCGSSEPGVDVAQAAQATSKQGTARMDMRVEASGFGIPGALELEASGVTALREARMELSTDLTSLASSFGLPLEDGKARFRLDGEDLYVQPPSIPGLELPGGATWVALDLRKAAESTGLDADALGAIFAMDPAAQLRALRAAKGMEEVGEEEIDGVSTTHLKGTLRLQDYLAGLPAEQREEARKALRKLDELTGAKEGLDQPMPVEMWVDDEGIARRFVSEQRFPGEKGIPGGKMSIRYDLSDFGAELDVSAPDEDDTYDATDALLSFFKGGFGAAAGGSSKTD